MARQEMINLDTCSLGDTHGWYVTTTTYCPPARGWTGSVGKDRGTLFSAWLGHGTYLATGY